MPRETLSVCMREKGRERQKMRAFNCAKNAEIFYGFIVEQRNVNTECGNKLT